MPDYFDFALPSTPGIRRTADFESAMSLTPMVGQLMELRERSQRLRSNDLNYRMAEYGFDRLKKDNDEFDSFTDDVARIHDETGGDPEQFGSRVFDLAVSMPGNERVQKTAQSLFGTFRTKNDYRTELGRSRMIGHDEATEEDRLATNLNNVATAKLQSEQALEKAREMDGVDDTKKFLAMGQWVQKFAFDENPEIAVKLVKMASRLDQQKDHDLLDRVTTLATIVPSHQSYKLANQEDYEFAGKFSQSLNGIGIDTAAFGTPEFEQAVQGYRDKLAKDPQRGMQKLAAFDQQYSKYTNVAARDVAYQRALSKIGELANMPDKADTKAWSEWVDNLNASVVVASKMAGDYADDVNTRQSRLESEKRTVELRKQIVSMANIENLMANRNALTQLAQLKQRHAAANGRRDEFIDSLKIMLSMKKEGLDMNDPELQLEAEKLNALIDEQAETSSPIDVLESE